MAEFTIKGSHTQNREKKFDLRLPAAREYLTVGPADKNDALGPEHLIHHAVQQRRHIRHKAGYSSPVVYKRYEPISMHNTYRRILARHPFPLLQGPLIPGIDSVLYAVKTSSENASNEDADILTAKTIFSHDKNQECGRWLPLKNGIDCWVDHSCYTPIADLKIDDGTYEVSSPEKSALCGPASSLEDRTLLYTCEFGNCTILCSCRICTIDKFRCEDSCETSCCEDCSYQCREHDLKLPWTFNSKIDQFTMVTTTTKLNYFHFATPYAGIPSNCSACSKDVLEHQVLHLAVHTKCKFCRQEFRPYDKRSVVTVSDFRRAELEMIKNEERTCQICFKKCEDKRARKKHEVKTHLSKTQKNFPCTKCEKRYSNKNALNYHYRTVHEKKKSCPEEKKDEETFQCEDCDQIFSVGKSLVRHMKLVHRYTDKNLDYAPTDNDILSCSDCDSTFLREHNLRRHKDTVHKEKVLWKPVQCPSCGKEFTLKHNLARHLKKQICQNLSK